MVVDLYRRARSYGAAVWTLTQTISEYRGAYTAGIIETTNIFMFVNSKGQGEAIHEVLGVPLAVGRAAERLRLEKGVYNELLYILYDQSGGIQGDVFRIYPTRWDYWLFTSHHEEVARRQAMAKQHGSLYKAIAKLANLDASDDGVVELVKEGRTRAEEIATLLRQEGRR
jgi:conjugal transfer ATP-binding protein TraC